MKIGENFYPSLTFEVEPHYLTQPLTKTFRPEFVLRDKLRVIFLGNMFDEKGEEYLLRLNEFVRAENLPLFALESKRPVREFDFLGFSLQYEMIYTNVLNMLDLAKISLHSDERADDEPFIIGGGPCVYNVEPVAGSFRRSRRRVQRVEKFRQSRQSTRISARTVERQGNLRAELLRAALFGQ